MANFRCERLYVMLDEPVPGIDHLKAVDPVEFAHIYTDDPFELRELKPLSQFTYAPFERKRWSPAAEGLKTIRGLIKRYQEQVSEAKEENKQRVEILKQNLVVLAQVETVLDAADSRDRRFYLAAKDLA